MSDNKDITELEHKLLKLVDNAINKGLDFDPWVFIADLRQIMPPTCGHEQRKFLDEVEKLEYDSTFGLLYKNYPVLDIGCFAADISKVVKGE
jgi:hypothetical protein